MYTMGLNINSSNLLGSHPRPNNSHFTLNIIITFVKYERLKNMKTQYDD